MLCINLYLDCIKTSYISIRRSQTAHKKMGVQRIKFPFTEEVTEIIAVTFADGIDWGRGMRKICELKMLYILFQVVATWVCTICKHVLSCMLKFYTPFCTHIINNLFFENKKQISILKKACKWNTQNCSLGSNLYTCSLETNIK